MLTFCPYEFIEIDMENLAYELTFPKGWSWDEVKEKTVVGNEKRKFIVENDTRRYEHFKNVSKSSHIVLLENKKKGGKNGFQIFKELIEYNNEKVRMDYVKKSSNNELGVKEVKKIGYLDEVVEQDNMYGITGQNDFIYEEDGFEGNESKKMLYHRQIEQCDTFVDEHDNIIMYAIPCCPKCHNRLPIGWKQAEDFGAVSLMAPSGTGKTTFLCSMMNRDWHAFQNLSYGGIGRINITAAHLMNDEADATYAAMKKQAEGMCKTGGQCIQSTDTEHWIPPIFLNVQYEGHTCIIGIYDNSGENLRIMDLIKNPNLRMLLNKMFAEIYLFDPRWLNISLPKERKREIWEKFEECKILSLKEQGEYQVKHAGKNIDAKELLQRQNVKVNGGYKPIDAMEVYRSHLSSMQQNNYLWRLKEMYFLGVIIKSDLLEDIEEIRSRGEYDLLFDRDISDDMLDLNSMEIRSELVQEMIHELRLFGNEDIDKFKEDFGEIDANGNLTGKKAVSWHCISAQGCGATENGTLAGEYAPIRVAEPMVTCIVKFLIDKGWIK